MVHVEELHGSREDDNPRAHALIRESVCWLYGGRRFIHGWLDAFEVIRGTILDNPMCSAKLAHNEKEGNFRVEILPNPFGGVNTFSF